MQIEQLNIRSKTDGFNNEDAAPRSQDEDKRVANLPACMDVTTKDYQIRVQKETQKVNFSLIGCRFKQSKLGKNKQGTLGEITGV